LDEAKLVEDFKNIFRTRVRFPPPPPRQTGLARSTSHPMNIFYKEGDVRRRLFVFDNI